MKRSTKAPQPDAVAAHPDAARALNNLFAAGLVSPGDKATKWRTHPQYYQLFSGIKPEKFRKRFCKLMEDYNLGKPASN